MRYAITELNSLLAEENGRPFLVEPGPEGSQGIPLVALFGFSAVIELPSFVCYAL